MGLHAHTLQPFAEQPALAGASTAVQLAVCIGCHWQVYMLYMWDCLS